MAARARKSPAAKAQSGNGSAYARGVRLLKSGAIHEALGAFEAALAERPDDPAVLFALANTARRLDMADAAIRFYHQVLAIEPDRIEALVNLSNACREAGRHAEATETLKGALQRNPEAPDLWLSLAAVMREGGDIANAETFLRECLRLRPKTPEALANLADIEAEKGNRNEALALFSKAAKLAGNDAQLQLNRALYLLAYGELSEGWQAYDWRLRLPGKQARVKGMRRWNGKPLTGRALFVAAEQGIGDQIMFAAWLDALKERVGPVVMDCDPRLVPLLARSCPEMRVLPRLEQVDRKSLEKAGIDSAPERLPDHFIEIGSLPRFTSETAERPVASPAYLTADPDQRAQWRGWLDSLGARPKVGLCWRSGNTAGIRQLMFAPLAAWTQFAKREGVTFVCAQYDPTAEELAAFEDAGCPLHLPPGLDQKQEIDRTAALLAELDAIVSAPTAVAALSAAMGTPTLKIIRDLSWTSLGRTREPFAPACRLVRAETPGDWHQALDRAGSILHEEIAQR